MKRAEERPFSVLLKDAREALQRVGKPPEPEPESGCRKCVEVRQLRNELKRLKREMLAERITLCSSVAVYAALRLLEVL